MGGHKPVGMEALRKVFEAAGFKNVQTYVQSGNVVFSAPKQSGNALERKISAILLKEFGFPVPTMIRTAEEMELVVQRNPFRKEDPAMLHVAFLSKAPDKGALKKLEEREVGPDRFRCVGTEIYIHCPNGFGRAKLPNFEKILSLSVTTRNWRTVNTLCEMSRKAN